jgi:DNA-binding transcriptional regulator GbsR (MarR family)
MNLPNVEYAEHVGRYWSDRGGNRAQGKMLGWLLISDPPHQSSKQLQEVLHMSAGTVSTNARILEQIGFIERVTFPSDRATYYRMATDAWEYLLDEKRIGMIGLRKIVEEGHQVLGGTPTEQHDRINQLAELLDFLDIEMAALAERWHARKEAR